MTDSKISQAGYFPGTMKGIQILLRDSYKIIL